MPCQRLYPPYETVRYLESKKIGPCFGSGPGDRPYSSSSVSLANEGGDAPQGALPGLLRGGPRMTPADAVHCGGPPRVSARQRGILAFRPLTVVGPGRVHSARRGCPSTARGRGCVSHRSQVPLPVPACKTPPEGAPRRVDRDMSRLAKISPDVKSRFRY